MSANGRRLKRGEEEAICRLDQWLWFARLVKSRSLAARLVAAGAVRLNGGSVKKPAHRIRVGDEIALREGAYRRSLRVLGLGARRGPAAEARTLYEEASAPQGLENAAAKWTPLPGEGEESLPFPRRRPDVRGPEDRLCEDEDGWFEFRSAPPSLRRRVLSRRSAASSKKEGSQEAPWRSGARSTALTQRPTSARRAPRTRSAAK